MAVPTSLASLSTTPGSNPPGGAENPFPELDDHLRAIYAFVAALRDGKLDASLVSSFIRTLLDDTDAASARTTIGAVGLTGNETIAGTKTFSSPPVVPNAAAAGNPVRKDQFDTATAAATTTARGTVELADETEARALTNATNALTPATLAAALAGSNQSLSASGFQRLPGGLILQWGEVTTSTSGDVSVTFPLAFPTACASVIGTGTQPINASVFVAASQTTTGFTATCWYTSSSSGTLRGSGVYRWIALGY